MKRLVVSSSLATLLVAAGCHDTLGPPLRGQWAADGIELEISAEARELRLPCRKAELPLFTLVDQAGTVRFGGRMTDGVNATPFTFIGQVHGDTMTARLEIDGRADHFVMVANAEPGFGVRVCAVAF